MFSDLAPSAQFNLHKEYRVRAFRNFKTFEKVNYM